MIQKCLNCGTELTIKNSQIEHDTLGSYVICDKCGASFDINNTTTEWCSNCENETEIELEGGHCKHCGKWLKPCSMCDMDKVNCTLCNYKNEGDK